VRGDLRALAGMRGREIIIARSRTESPFYRRFYAERTLILGALLDAVSCALRNAKNVRLDRIPRMADFAVWSEAAAPVLGWKPGALLDAYESNRRAGKRCGAWDHQSSTRCRKIALTWRAELRPSC
jgi:hypothetical protein